ncbi:MAG: ferrous iron transporter B, partial [Candidatus Krumholzibacteriia bacterium]
LLYFPCTAALAAVYRETNLRWTLFVAGWTTGVGYIAATVFYQAAIFSRSPATSAAWIAAMLGIFLAVTLVLRSQGAARGAGSLARQQA